MGNRSIHRVMLIAAVSVTGLAGLGAAAEAPQAITVQLFQFRPGQIEVPKGSRVTWTNGDDITHTVTSGTPAAKPMAASRPASRARAGQLSPTFSEAGTYPYFCERTPECAGEVLVPDAPSPRADHPKRRQT